MPATYSWDTIYDSVNTISEPIAQNVIDLMKETAKVAVDRDFKTFAAPDLRKKVGYKKNENGHVNDKVNYMKVHTGRVVGNPAGQIDLVIIYHYLNHRSDNGSNPKQGTWATSVGFRKSIVPAVSVQNPGTIQPNDPNWDTYEFVTLARAIAEQMNFDLKSFSPQGLTSYIYDDVDRKMVGTDPTVQGTRRTTPIGELGWVSQNDPKVKTKFSYQSKLETVPRTSTGLYIPPGYYRPGDTKIVITELKAL